MREISDSTLNTMDEDDGMANRDLCEDEYITMDSRRCRCVTCRPGFQAHICNTGDPDTSFCQKCPEHHFKTNISVLGRNGQCKFRRTCDGPRMKILSPGGPTEDATCTCEDGYQLTSASSACARYDPADYETPKPQTKGPSAGKTDNAAPLSDASTGGAESWKVIVPVAVVSMVLVACVILVILYRRRKKQKPQGKVLVNEQSRLLEKSIQDISDRDLHNKVLTFCFKEIELKIGKDWKRLGKHLLDDDLDYALEGIADSSIEEKVSEILKKWHRSHGFKATTKVLLDALRSIKREDIIDHLCHKVHEDPELGMHFRQEDDLDLV